MTIGQALAAAAGYAARVYLRWDTQVYAVGDMLPASRRWRDGDVTGMTYAGTCVLDPRARFDPTWDYRVSYPGSHVYVVTGSRPVKGQDRGEVRIRRPKVIAVLC